MKKINTSPSVTGKITRISGYVTSWWSGYCDSNKRECDLNQSKDGSFVKWVAKNNSWNNGARHKIHGKFLMNCFVFVIILVWQTVHSSAMTQITANLMGENVVTNCSRVTVLAVDSLTRNTLATTLLWKFFPSDHQVGASLQPGYYSI